MKNYIFTDNNGLKYRRVSRQMAKRLYNNGANVVLCPSNLRPFGAWSCETTINVNNYRDESTDKIGKNVDNFDRITNEFLFYNCVNNETGRYIAFYVPTDK